MGGRRDWRAPPPPRTRPGRSDGGAPPTCVVDAAPPPPNPQVLTVRDILSYGVDSHMGARVDLEELAMRALEYRLADGADAASVSEADRVYLTDDYKRRVLEHMSIGQLIDTIMINPTVHLAPSSRDTGLVATYAFQPLSNLVYTRDQQVTTCRGVVMARLRSPQRQLEVDLMRFALRKLGLPIIGQIEAPGFLEGGDFFAAGRSLAMVGIGLRSNMEACQQLMEGDLLGTERLAVVRDDFEQSQVGWGGAGRAQRGRWNTKNMHQHTHPHAHNRTACTWTAASPSWATRCASCWTR